MTKKLFLRNARGERLAAVLHIPRQKSTAAGGAIVCHGFNHHKDEPLFRQLGLVLERAGYWVLRFDYSGQGGSEGAFEGLTYSKYLTETKLAIDELEKRGVERIGLIGHSMGGALAALMAARDKRIQWLVALAPVTKIYATHAKRFRETPGAARAGYLGVVDFRDRKTLLKLPKSFLADAKKYDLLKESKRIVVPVLVIRAGQDEKIHSADIQAFVSRLPTSRRKQTVIAGAKHAFKGKEGVVSEKIAAWIGGWPTTLPALSPTIWIDTSELNRVTLGLVSEGRWVEKTAETNRDTRDQLLQTIQAFLKSQRLTLSALRRVCVIKGPGPFTAVRVGVTVANTLGYAAGMSVCGIRKRTGETLSQVYQRWTQHPTPAETVVKPYYDRPPNITKPKKN